MICDWEIKAVAEFSWFTVQVTSMYASYIDLTSAYHLRVMHIKEWVLRYNLHHIITIFIKFVWLLTTQPLVDVREPLSHYKMIISLYVWESGWELYSARGQGYWCFQNRNRDNRLGLCFPLDRGISQMSWRRSNQKIMCKVNVHSQIIAIKLFHDTCIMNFICCIILTLHLIIH